MQGNILIVEPVATNRIGLKVKLKSAFYNVLQAESFAQARATIRDTAPDLVITAMNLPDGTATQVAKWLQQDSRTDNIPIIAVGHLGDQEERIAALDAGIHDVLGHQVSQTLLQGRVRSLIRASYAAAEWQMREDTCRALGLAEPAGQFAEQAHVVLVGSDAINVQGYVRRLRGVLRAKIEQSSYAHVLQETAAARTPDIYVLLLNEDQSDALEQLRLISTLRAAASSRHAGVIVVQHETSPALGATALDLGADDLMADGFEEAELALRIKAVMRRKRMGERLRACVRTGLQAAVFDPLTGLYNRRYAMPHLGRIAARANQTDRTFAVMAADLDHFKRVNDQYGHASGDAVLVEVAKRLREGLRSTDMVARIGGEEFLLILPGTTLMQAQNTAMRICNKISAVPFDIPGSSTPINVTISVGVAISAGSENGSSDPEEVGMGLLAQADTALYAAKGKGRNQVKFGRPAA